jgi:hypothetical protein
LSPSYWKQLSISAAKTNQSVFQSPIIFGNGGTLPLAVPLSKDARFYGFPAGFYLKKSNVVNEMTPGIPSTVTAFSWLMATIDGSIFIIFLVIAIWFNRYRSSQLENSNQTFVT